MNTLRIYAYAAVAAILLAAGAWWHLSRINAAERAVHAHYAAVLSEIKDRAAAAATAFRAAESAWHAQFEMEAKNGQNKLDQARRDADAARTTADSMRAALARYRATTGAATDPGAAGAGQGEQDSTALDLLAGMLTRHTAELVEVGAYADQLRAAGLTCERSADSLKSDGLVEAWPR